MTFELKKKKVEDDCLNGSREFNARKLGFAGVKYGIAALNPSAATYPVTGQKFAAEVPPARVSGVKSGRDRMEVSLPTSSENR